MMDWFALALEKAQAEGKNPTLAELIDMSVYMEDVSNRNVSRRSAASRTSSTCRRESCTRRQRSRQLGTK